MRMYSVTTKMCGLLLSAATAAATAQTIKTQISLAQAPVGIAANPLTNKIYVAVPSYGGGTDTVTVIDGKTDTISADITVPSGAQLPVVDLLHNRVFVVGCDTYSSTFTCLVTSINTITNKVINSATITTTTGDGILGATYDPVLEKLYLADGSNFRIDVVDGTSLKQVDTISTEGKEPFGLSFDPINGRLYVPYYSNLVQIFNASTKAVVDTVRVGSQDVATAVNWNTGHVFIADNVFGPSTTGVADQNGKLLATVRVSDTPYSLDVDPVTNKAFVVSVGVPALSVIDGATNTISSSLPGISANFISVNFATEKVYLSTDTGVTVVTEK
jgi:DNA-binding beta-propeller fold protein YncE